MSRWVLCRAERRCGCQMRCARCTALGEHDYMPMKTTYYLQYLMMNETQCGYPEGSEQSLSNVLFVLGSLAVASVRPETLPHICPKDSEAGPRFRRSSYHTSINLPLMQDRVFRSDPDRGEVEAKFTARAASTIALQPRWTDRPTSINDAETTSSWSIPGPST